MAKDGKKKDKRSKEERKKDSDSSIKGVEGRLAEDSLWLNYMHSDSFKGKIRSVLGELVYSDSSGMPHLRIVNLVIPGADVKHGTVALHSEYLLEIYRKIASGEFSSNDEKYLQAVYSIMLKARFSKYFELESAAKDVVSVFNKEVPSEYRRSYGASAEPC